MGKGPSPPRKKFLAPPLLEIITSQNDKKLSCRRETARCFMSLNISLSHSKSLKVTENGTIQKLGYGFVFALWLCLESFPR